MIAEVCESDVRQDPDETVARSEAAIFLHAAVASLHSRM